MKELRKEAENLNKVLKLAYDRFEGLQIIKNIIQDWDVGEIRDLKGSLNKLIDKGTNHAMFGVIIPPGQSFSPHRHPEHETITVINGILKDHILEGEWKQSDVLEIEPTLPHAPYNGGDYNLTLQVDFKW